MFILMVIKKSVHDRQHWWSYKYKPSELFAAAGIQMSGVLLILTKVLK